MSFKWKRLILFGLSIGVPAIVFLVRALDEKCQLVFSRHREDMVNCKTCHDLFDGRAGARWITHLIDSHNVDLDLAIETTKDIYKQLLIRKADKLQEKN